MINSTVDLISYTVRSLTPVATLDEAAQGTGELCGSIYLNRKFRRYLDRKFRGCSFFTDALRSHMMEAFEDDIKKRFMGDTSSDFVIRGVINIHAPHVGISNGRFSIPGQDIKSIFAEVISSVIALVTKQVHATNKSVKKILLAGGFGKNLYLKEELQKAMDRDNQKLKVEQISHRCVSCAAVPCHGARALRLTCGRSDTAVVRGALLTGFARVDRNRVHARAAGRIATKSYGVLKYDKFDARKGHDKTRMSFISTPPYTLRR